MKIYLTKNHTLFTLLPSQAWMLYFLWVLSYRVFFLAVFMLLSKDLSLNPEPVTCSHQVVSMMCSHSLNTAATIFPWSRPPLLLLGPACLVSLWVRTRLYLFVPQGQRKAAISHLGCRGFEVQHRSPFLGNSRYFSPPPWTHLLPQSNTSHITNDIHTHTSFPGFSPVLRRPASSSLHGTRCRRCLLHKRAGILCQNLKTLISYLVIFLFQGNEICKSSLVEAHCVSFLY